MTNLERKALQRDVAFNKIFQKLTDVELSINRNVKSVEDNLRLKMTNMKDSLTLEIELDRALVSSLLKNCFPSSLSEF